MRKQIVTANRIGDGAVVYLSEDRRWVFDPTAALATDDRKLADELVAWGKTQSLVVLDPYAIEVEIGGASVRQLSARERIRAAGPDAMLARLGYVTQQQLRAAG